MPSRTDRDPVAEFAQETEDEARPIVGVTDPALIEPFDDQVLIRLDPPIAVTRGGIFAPDSSVPESRTGWVVSQGPGQLLPDGRGRARMNARPGDRVLFERRAGKTIPRLPDESTAGKTGYLLIANGSLQCVLEPAVSGPEDVHPCGDWTLIQRDRAPVAVDRAAQARRNGVLGPGLVLPESARAATRDHWNAWTGTVVRRGPGRLTDDGQRHAEPRAALGARVFYLASQLNQDVPGLDGGRYVLVLERAVVVGGAGL